MSKKKATVIAVANQKGGTAKTTTCENLGIGLADAGKDESSRKKETKESASSGDETAMIAKLLSNPETASLLKALVKAMDSNDT